MLEGRPSQVGVAKTRISESRIWARMPGHSSPLPHLRLDPGRDRVVDGSHRGHLDALLTQSVGDDFGKRLGV
jgi:hypothetical protein